MLNLHPYSNGHLLVAPLAHLGLAAGQLARRRAAELWPLVLRAQRVLAAAYAPHGFNLGMNLGQPAGAGVPDHYHFHVVPRWTGDTNFMTVLAEVRLVPEDLRQSRERLRALFATPGKRRNRLAETGSSDAPPRGTASRTAPVAQPLPASQLVMAVALAWLVPGLGHVYLKRTVRGAGLLRPGR